MKTKHLFKLTLAMIVTVGLTTAAWSQTMVGIKEPVYKMTTETPH